MSKVGFKVYDLHKNYLGTVEILDKKRFHRPIILKGPLGYHSFMTMGGLKAFLRKHRQDIIEEEL